ncbi:DHH family phosphoesterase [Alkalicoccobacillus plakortidis]|uniref:Bifunctional oligoribonuclease/PAP phosphatase NrnA n=1 Tax=Alkalicoccobacillus plakortidis TaxID=444060 RepID=A0ABT0XH79_9BACI|nr:bifunctional oligoribonuclease/PAP phosphatase NrnA [Alkalicoccobacillus plakortidis]MCM2675275.1 bifunctional oligoribonuclease/PAP phosphatase NrnA [Alkalicoccobacillus plakortidis]
MKQAILEKISKYNTIIIHRHVRPDPDALGSQLGLAAILKEAYQNKNIYTVGESEPSLLFLGEMDTITDEEYNGALVIVCDSANQERISDDRFRLGAELIKIDHHPNEEPYGDVVWVDVSASSTSEMIVELVEGSRELSLSKSSALLLYAGIVGDTGRFRYPNTKPETLRRTALLLEQDIEVNDFYAELYKRDLRMTRLEGYVLQHFEIHHGCVGVMKLRSDVLETFDVTSNESSQLVNTFSSVEGLMVWVFFVEEADRIRVRLRSRGPIINGIAQEHQGGGHTLASGATAYSWEETDEIISKLIKVCESE